MKGNNRRGQKLLAMALSAALVLTMGAPALADGTNAATKEEVIYANLAGDGSVTNIYAVNIFHSNGGKITDYGDYSSVRNLTTEDEIKLNNGEVTGMIPEEKFYYQGNLNSKDLPWNISIQYFLDGQGIAAEDLAGRSGALEIRVSITQNEKVDSQFFEHYALQATLSLDTNKCTEIEAQGATVANVGAKKQLTYMILPNKGKDISIKANVRDFEFDGISINGINMELDIDDPDTGELTDQVSELQDGIAELDDGAKDLQSGASDLADGFAALKTGLGTLGTGANQVNQGATSLYSGVKELKQGISDLSAGLTTLSGKSGELTTSSKKVLDALTQIQSQLPSGDELKGQLAALEQGNKDAKAGVHKLADGLSELAKASAGINTAVGNLKSTLSGLNEIGTMAQGLLSSSDPDAVNTGRAILGKLQEINQKFGDVETMSKKVSAFNDKMQEAAKQAKTLATKYDALYSGIETLIASAKALPQLSSGISELKDNYTLFHKGVASYTNGVDNVKAGSDQLKRGAQKLYGGTGELKAGTNALANGSKDLSQGANALNQGAGQLKDGTGTLKDGTGELRDKTSDMDTKITDKVDEMIDDVIGGEFVPISFLSEKNTNVEAVQFVIQTQAVEIPEQVEQEEVKEEPTFWQRIVNLFQ